MQVVAGPRKETRSAIVVSRSRARSIADGTSGVGCWRASSIAARGVRSWWEASRTNSRSVRDQSFDLAGAVRRGSPAASASVMRQVGSRTSYRPDPVWRAAAVRVSNGRAIRGADAAGEQDGDRDHQERRGQPSSAHPKLCQQPGQRNGGPDAARDGRVGEDRNDDGQVRAVVPVVLPPVDGAGGPAATERSGPGDPYALSVVDADRGPESSRPVPHPHAGLEHVVGYRGHAPGRVPLQAGQRLSGDEPVQDDPQRHPEQHQRGRTTGDRGADLGPHAGAVHPSKVVERQSPLTFR